MRLICPVCCVGCWRKETFTVIPPTVRFVQFFMRLGCGKGVPDPRSQPVLLQYSLNGGLTWSLLQEFLFSNSSNVGRYIALEIPMKARSSSTRLRWWQPSENGHFYSPWVIDQVSSLHCLFVSFFKYKFIYINVFTVCVYIFMYRTVI